MFNSLCVADGLSCTSIVITIEGLTIYHTKHLYDPHHSHDLSTKIFTMTHFHSLFQKLPLLRPNLEMLVCWEEISQEIEILADAAYRFCPLWMSSHKNQI